MIAYVFTSALETPGKMMMIGSGSSSILHLMYSQIVKRSMRLRPGDTRGRHTPRFRLHKSRKLGDISARCGDVGPRSGATHPVLHRRYLNSGRDLGRSPVGMSTPGASLGIGCHRRGTADFS